MAVAETDAPSAQPARRESMEELFAALESPLLHYALRLLGDRALAEDTVQEAFMKLHVHFADVREPRRWLYRTVHNLALNHRRQSGKLVPLHPQTEPGDEPASAPIETADLQPLPDEQIARWEGIGLVRLSLQTLDERSRELVRLKFIEELSYKEISERTGLKTGHVGYLLHHAVKAIAAELAKTGVVP
jgi:RNA polymerase sigma-70 factor (ECF subfamily)